MSTKPLFKYYLLAIIFLSISNYLFGQATDCVDAFGVCSNSGIDENSSGSGIDDFGHGQGSLGCIDQEHQSLWLFVQVESGNTLGFDLDPNSGDDYDFAVYGPDLPCSDLGNPIRCSWAAGSSNTGMNNAANDLSEDAGGNGYVHWLNVIPGQTYYILIDNYSNTNQGFSMNWTGNSNLNCDVTNPCPSFDLGSDTAVCDGSFITIGISIIGGSTYEWSTGETTPTIDVTTSGIYWLAVTKDTCTIIDSIEVSLFTSPIVDLGQDTTLCEGETIVINATNAQATGYLWQDGSTSPFYTVTSTGTYTVEVIDGICSTTDAIQVTFDVIPTIDLGNDTVLCDLNSFQLNASSPYADNYTWQNGFANPVFTATSSGIYSVIVENTGCSFTDEIILNFQNAPVFELGPDETYCEGTVVTLNAFSPTATAYLWEDSSVNNTLVVTETGEYKVTVSNNVCSARDSIIVTFLEFPIVQFQNDTTLCENDTLILSAYSAVADTYIWQNGSSNPEFSITQEGTYYVSVSNDFCTTSDTINIEYLFLPVFDLGQDTIMCKGNPYQLLVLGQNDNVTYTWQDNSTDSLFIVNVQGNYYVDVENQCGVKTDSVFVQYGSCDCNFYLPTAFTPNNDGLNDIYQPIYDCDSIMSFEFQIYNRWGDQVFVTDDPSYGWTEPSKNIDNLIDVYVWVMRYSWTWRGNEMSNQETGFFTIIR